MLFYIIFSIVCLGLLILTLKKPFWSLLILLFFIPLHAFLVTYLQFAFNLNEAQRLILPLWKEWIIFSLLIWSVITLVKLKTKNQPSIKLFWFDYLIFGLFILALLSIIWGIKNSEAIIYGIRYDFEFFAIYFIGRILRPDINQLKIAVYTLLAGSLIPVVFAIFQATVLPWDFLNKFGYSYALEWTPGTALQSSQIVGSTRDLSRIISTLSGPNQLGTYLSLICVFLLAIILFARKYLFKGASALYFLIILLPLYRTYSRSAWLGLFVSILALMIYLLYRIFSKKQKTPKSGFLIPLFAILILIIIVISSFVYIYSVNDVLINSMLVRGFSTSNHFDSMVRGFNLIIQNPFGLGIGSAGPASQWSMGIENAVITESSFLQFGVELGFLGIIAFAVIIIALVVKLFREISIKNEGTLKIILLGSALGLISLAISSLFLHGFSDTATSFSLFALIGMALNNRKNIDVINS